MTIAVTSGKIGQASLKRWIWGASVVGILLLAFGLRMLHLDFGLPQRLHPDEWSQVEVAWRIAQGDPNPHFFRYPTSFLYLLAGLYRLSTPLDLAQPWPSLYMVARIVSALLGTATVALTILWGRLIWSKWTGLVAGAFLAVSYNAIEHSHYATVDGPMAFWVTATLALLTAAALRSHIWLLRLAAITTGLAIATKYTAVLLILPLIVAAWGLANTNRPLPRLWTRFLTGLLASIVAVLAVSALALYVEKTTILARLTTLTTDGHLEQEYLLLYDKIIYLLGSGSAGPVDSDGHLAKNLKAPVVAEAFSARVVAFG